MNGRALVVAIGVGVLAFGGQGGAATPRRMATVPVCVEGLWEVHASGNGGGDWQFNVVQERDTVVGVAPLLMTGTIRDRDVTAHYYGLSGRTIDVRFTLERNCRALAGTWHEPRTNRGGRLRGSRTYRV
jgi:hypothetical protein